MCITEKRINSYLQPDKTRSSCVHRMLYNVATDWCMMWCRVSRTAPWSVTLSGEVQCAGTSSVYCAISVPHFASWPTIVACVDVSHITHDTLVELYLLWLNSLV